MCSGRGNGHGHGAHRPLPSTSLLLLTLSSLVTIVAQSKILYDTCMNEGDFGGNEERGIVYNACIMEHQFEFADHPWILTKSKIIRTSFEHCIFHDWANRTQSFVDTYWREVTFSHCAFHSSNMVFSDATFDRVVFINCTFATDARMIFDRVSLTQVVFESCNFGGGTIKVSNGEIRSMEFRKCTFGVNSVRSPASYRMKQGGDLQFSYLSVESLVFEDCRGDTNAISFAYATIDNLQIRKSTIGLFNCSIVTFTPEQDAQRHVQLSHAIIVNSTFSYGFSCLNAHVDSLLVWNLDFGDRFELAHSTMASPVLHNLTSAKGTLNMSHVDIHHGMVLTFIATKKVTFDHAHIQPAAVSFLSPSSVDKPDTANQWSWEDDHINIFNTVFPSLFVGLKCCSILCQERQCKCNETAINEQLEQSVDLTDAQCPSLTKETRYSEGSEDGACFPAAARMHVTIPLTGSAKMIGFGNAHNHQNRTIRSSVPMDRVTLGMVSDPPSYGAVYFFGHSDPETLHSYISITVSLLHSSATRTVVVSSDHLIPIIQMPSGEIIKPARHVRHGDYLLCTMFNKGLSICQVTAIGHQRSEKGLFAPVTTSGRMVVDGVVVSCFTTHVSERVAHALLVPLRLIFNAGGKISAQILSRCSWLHRQSAAGTADRLANRLAWISEKINQI